MTVLDERAQRRPAGTAAPHERDQRRPGGTAVLGEREQGRGAGTALLDERAQRRARVTAAAAHVAARPGPRRALVPPPPGSLRGTTRRRLHAEVAAPARAVRRPSGRHRGRVLAGLVVELMALAAMLLLPLFRATDVAVDGASLLGADRLLDLAAVPSTSLFLIDGDEIRRRLESHPFVRRASVVTSLPSTVRITVEEARPSLRLQLRDRAELVAGDGATVDAATIAPGSAPRVPVAVDDRQPSPLGGGARLDAALVSLLSLAAERLPDAAGCSVVAFQWDGSGVFSIWMDRGWRAILGHLDTAEQVAAAPEQLAALAGLRAQLDVPRPPFGYVNLENPGSPTAGGSPGLPPEIAALDPGGSAAQPVPATAAPGAATPGAAAPGTVAPGTAAPGTTTPGTAVAGTAPAPLSVPGTAPAPAAAPGTAAEGHAPPPTPSVPPAGRTYVIDVPPRAGQ